VSAAGRAAVSRGILLRLREQLEFTKKGQELLKMKRDHLASETNKLLSKLNERNELDRQLMEAYETLKTAYLSLGFSGLDSQAVTVNEMCVRVRPRSIMGVIIPEALIEKKADIGSISSPSALPLLPRLNGIFDRDGRL
jgi:vacuolar-type H+-ATPase subunit D/Vma8